MLLENMIHELRPDLSILGVTTDITSSMNAISSHPDIDIIFSDIKIDDGLSFSVFEQVQTTAMIVFTTAYDEFALRAFEYNCVDYLMKPISKELLERALTKCEQRIPHADMMIIRSAVKEIRQQKVITRKRLLLQRGQDTMICNVNDICYIFTEKGNTRVFLKDRIWGDIDISLIELSKSLPDNQFCRVNRQAIVNISFVGGVAPGPGRDSIISLIIPYEGRQFQITQDRKKELLKHLGV